MSLYELGSRLRATAKQREYHATLIIDGVTQGIVDGDTTESGVAEGRYVIGGLGSSKDTMITVRDGAPRGQGLQPQTRWDINHASPDRWDSSGYLTEALVRDVHGSGCSFLQTVPSERSTTFAGNDRRIHTATVVRQ